MPKSFTQRAFNSKNYQKIGVLHSGKCIIWFIFGFGANYTGFMDSGLHTGEQINGSIFLLLRKFVEDKLGHNRWVELSRAAGNKDPYHIHKNYALFQINSIVKGAADLLAISETEVKEKFGEYLVPDLLNFYKQFIDPSWKTYEMLLYTEKIMHHAVRQQNPSASPPVLHIDQVGERTLVIDYYSKRRLASLAIGIIKGIAAYYHESDKIHIIPTTNANDERVQIRIEFS